jgi:hypothetical protein
MRVQVLHCSRANTCSGSEQRYLDAANEIAAIKVS